MRFLCISCLTDRLRRAGDPILPGIVGFDDTVTNGFQNGYFVALS